MQMSAYQPQTIILGLHLDGGRPFPGKSSIGEMVAGPLGILNGLETQLGLLQKRATQSERIVEYRDCLKRVDGPNRFFHQTFALDELGTAATLLQWRDLWRLHGWDGSLPVSAPHRLVDLAAVELVARDVLAPSVGERLDEILITLQRRRHAVGSVLLADPVEAFPAKWQAVLAKLPVVPFEAKFPISGSKSTSTYLSHLQQSLVDISAGKPVVKVPWKDDGSVCVVQGETLFLSGGWLASALEEDMPTLLVAATDRERLDASVVTAAQSRNGFGETSAFRPALQVLPLALEILWEPINLYGLVQFLTHSICPVPDAARQIIAEKIAERPGIGGRDWQKALSKIDAHYGERGAEVRHTIEQWVEHPRHSQATGAPTDAVLARVEMLAVFFRARLGDTDPARQQANAAAHAQCVACARGLQALLEQGLTVIKPRQLQILVAHVTSQGSDNPLLVPEVGCRQAISNPGAAVAPVYRVIWWQMAMPSLPAADPWSGAEIKALSICGLRLPTMSERLKQLSSEWLRPILAAGKRLVLVLPPEGAAPHPVWQLITTVTEHIEVVPLVKLMSAASTVQTKPVKHRPLPPRTRWWQLPEDVAIPMPNSASFSSLELWLFNPYHWLLRYPAQLQSSSTVTMTDDFRMRGNLAHRMIERFYLDSRALTMTDKECRTWFEAAFSPLIEEEGALLLAPGKVADLQGFKTQLWSAMSELRRQLNAVDIVQVTPEMPLSGSFIGGPLKGSADLVLQRSDDHFAIIDMKWAGANKYSKKLQGNTHLQLALYSELVRQQRVVSSSVAYHILDDARFYAADNNFFPHASVAVNVKIVVA